MLQVEEQLERFRAREEFDGSVNTFIVDGKPDDKALQILTEALRNEDEMVRLQVGKLLVAIGHQTDPLFAEGGRLLRDSKIVAALVECGLSRQDAVRNYCLETLRRFVPVELLRQHGSTLTKDLRKWPCGIAFLLVAKAKPPDAAGVVDSLSRLPEWADNRKASIAKAALGYVDLEKKFVQRFLATRDPKEKADLAEGLGLIGTESTLQALASEMRTDLIIEKPMVFLKSVRVNIVAALSYAFPEKTFLYQNSITDDSGYTRVEAFCQETFGVEWTTPRPPFLWIQGFPSRAGDRSW